jgi:predicted metal-dependent hydrolase
MIFIFRRRRRKRKPLTAAQAEEVERLRAQAKAALPPRLAELAALHGFTYNSVRIKHNVSNWGSCSTKGNINLNLNLMRVPQEEADYVLLHELAHLRHPNHGPQFHALLDRLCRDGLGKGEAELEKALKGRRIL